VFKRLTFHLFGLKKYTVINLLSRSRHTNGIVMDERGALGICTFCNSKLAGHVSPQIFLLLVGRCTVSLSLSIYIYPEDEACTGSQSQIGLNCYAHIT
jgi:hypothetical protein